MGTGSAVIARGQQLVGCEETIVHYQGRPVCVRGREGGGGVEDEGGRGGGERSKRRERG